MRIHWLVHGYKDYRAVFLRREDVSTCQRVLLYAYVCGFSATGFSLDLDIVRSENREP